jgi:hypothetical protein
MTPARLTVGPHALAPTAIVELTFDGRPAQFLRSEDAERFQNRLGRNP